MTIARPKPLSARLLAFAGGYPRAELVDSLVLTDVQQHGKKVDVFFEDRHILAEIKSIETDVGPKIDRILEPYREREDFPAYYGKWPIEKVLERLPDGEQVRRKLYEKVTDRVAEIVADANEQIRVTKNNFDLPSGHGLLIVLNDSVAVLDPNVVAHRIARTLSKRTSDGTLRYSEIGAVWIIAETHRIQLSSQFQGIPGIIMAHPELPDEFTLQFLSSLQKPWAEYEGLPLVELPEDSLPNLKFQAADDPADRSITLSSYWRRQYDASPYLHILSNEELILYGGRLTFELALLQESRFASRNALLRSTRRFADLNQELNRRHIDIRLVRRSADTEGLLFHDTAEAIEITKVLADACDESI